MQQQQRLNRILDALSTDGHLTIDEIVERFEVSAATARRDLGTLAQQRLITRTHGGAVAVGSAYELPLHYKIARNAEAKIAIAHTAAELINPGETLGLTGGTTTTELARVLGADPRMAAEDQPGITVLTNALNIAYELAIRSHIKLVLTGGVARTQSFELVGPMVGRALQDLVLDWAIIGVDGLDVRFGATTVDEGEAAVNRDLVKAARRVLVVADHSKMGNTAFGRICDLGSVTDLVTDRDVEPGLAAALAEAGVNVVVAAPRRRP